MNNCTVLQYTVVITDTTAVASLLMSTQAINHKHDYLYQMDAWLSSSLFIIDVI